MSTKLTSLATSGLSPPLNLQQSEDFSSVRTLAFHDNLVGDAILEGPLEHNEPIDEYRCLRQAAKVTSVVVSAVAKLPYMPVVWSLPGGPALAIANSAAFFNLEFWAINSTINDLMGPKGRCEILLLDRKARGKCYSVSLVTASVVLALLSQVPVALPALDYDPQYKVAGFTVLVIAGALLPLRSLQLSIDKAIQVQKCMLGDVGKKVEAIRCEMLDLVDQHRVLFTSMGYDRKLDLLSRLAPLRRGEGLNRLDKYVSTILEAPLDSPVVQRSPFCGRISTLVGIWFNASYQTALIMYTWSKTKGHFNNNDIIAGSFATITVLSGIYLTSKAIVGTTQRVARSFLNYLTCRKEKSLAEQIRPKLTLSLKFIGLLVNLAALGTTIVIWGDFFKGNTSRVAYFEFTMCASLFLLLSTATLDIIDDVIEKLIQSNSTPDEQQIIEFYNELQQFKQILHESPLVDFSVFLMKCPDTLKAQLLEKVDLSTESLEIYMDNRRLLTQA